MPQCLQIMLDDDNEQGFIKFITPRVLHMVGLWGADPLKFVSGSGGGRRKCSCVPSKPGKSWKRGPCAGSKREGLG
jgi:hypothetical protein